MSDFEFLFCLVGRPLRTQNLSPVSLVKFAFVVRSPGTAAAEPFNRLSIHSSYELLWGRQRWQVREGDAFWPFCWQWQRHPPSSPFKWHTGYCETTPTQYQPHINQYFGVYLPAKLKYMDLFRPLGSWDHRNNRGKLKISLHWNWRLQSKEAHR